MSESSVINREMKRPQFAPTALCVCLRQLGHALSSYTTVDLATWLIISGRDSMLSIFATEWVAPLTKPAGSCHRAGRLAQLRGGGRFYKYRYIKNSVIRIVFIRLVFLSQYALVSGSVWMPVQVYIQSHYTQVFVTSRSVTVCIRRINAIAYRRHSTKWREGNNGEGTAGHISHSGCVLHWLLRVFCLWKLLIFCKRVCNFYFKNEVILK